MSVRVVARIRPLLGRENDNDVIVHADGSESGKPSTIVKIPNPKNESEEFSFAFNGVYDQEATQEVLFTTEVSPHLKALFQGCDLTIFAYGVTGTGKTHTMRGGLKLADRGVIPRLLSSVFRRAKKLAKDTGGDTTVQVALSYYEIYNDKVYDLLETPEKRTPAGLPLREKDGRTFVVALSERGCGDLKDFEKLYIEANNNRATAATKLNAHSSRSHAILRVKLTQTTGGAVRESTASAIDLAGSEDNRRTDNSKERLVESAAINKSLFVLSQCIDAISRGDKRVPYRESKMTRILSLGQNNGITIMILNLAPLRSYHLDTLSSLNVSSRAKRIEVREIENEVVYKQVVPRGTSLVAPGSVSAITRQPLRPLAANTTAPSGVTTKSSADPSKPPVKAFSVYTDRARLAVARPTGASIVTTAQPRPPPSANKRSSDPDHIMTRPAKIARPTPGPKSQSQQSTAAAISTAQIEAMVERKVSEILAARAAHEQDQAAQVPAVAVQPDMSEAVRRRLDALERRIENEDRRNDDRSDGLKLLLAAKQAKERGDEPAALELYEAAVPFFPRETKLLSKIERLRAKLAPADDAAPLGGTSRPTRRDEPPSQHQEPGNGEHRLATTGDDDASFVGKPKTRRPKPQPIKAKLVMFSAAASESSAPASPRTQQLLDIVNSRDPARIRALSGFGAKRAADLVEQLRLVAEQVPAGGGHGLQLETLDQLKMVPGIGGRIVERAYEGLVPVGGGA